LRTHLVAALASHLVSGLEPLEASRWRAVRDALACAPEDASPDWLRENLEPSDFEAVSDRLDRLDDYVEALSLWESRGVQALTEFDGAYPRAWRERLGGKASSLVFVSGEEAVLNCESVGIVGSRHVDELGSSFAESAARSAAESGLAVVSGGAKGVDSLAMRAAFQAGGTVLGVLADSLGKAPNDREVEAMLESGRLALVSPNSPDAPFTVGNAMGRNKLIYAHSQGTLVVSSSLEEGGTWAGAVEALKLGLGPVLVRMDDDAPEGNRALASRGAIAVERPDGFWLASEGRSATQPGLFA